MGSLCDQETSPFGPFNSFVVIALLLLQLIWIDNKFPYFSDLFSLSSCRILYYFGSFGLFSLIVLVGHCDVCFWNLLGEDYLLHNITLFDSGFLDSLARLVYFIIEPDGLFVSRIHCQSFTSLSPLFHTYFVQIAQTYPYGQFNYCT